MTTEQPEMDGIPVLSANVLGVYGTRQPVYELVEVPEEFGPVELAIDDEKLKQFAFIVDDYQEWHFTGSPFGRPIAHAGLLANDVLQLFTLTYDPSRVVGLHTEEELWFEHPAFVGERVTLHGAYVEKYVRRGQGCVVMEADVKGEDGRRIFRHRGVEIMRTVPGEIAGRRSAEPPARRVTGTFRPELGFVQKVTAGLLPGTALVPEQHHITQAQMSLFSRAGEYVKNIHNDLEIARAGGLDRPIVQGQQLACLLLGFLSRRFGWRWFETGWLKVKFLKPISAGETVSLHGVVTDPQGGGAPRDEVELEVWIANQSGQMAVAGWARGRPS